MNYWQTVALVSVIAFFGTHAGALTYWRLHSKKRGDPRPTWEKAFGEAWSAAVAAAVALMIYAK